MVLLGGADPLAAVDLAVGVHLEHVLVAVGAGEVVDPVLQVAVERGRGLGDVVDLELDVEERAGGVAEGVGLGRGVGGEHLGLHVEVRAGRVALDRDEGLGAGAADVQRAALLAAVLVGAAAPLVVGGLGAQADVQVGVGGAGHRHDQLAAGGHVDGGGVVPDVLGHRAVELDHHRLHRVLGAVAVHDADEGVGFGGRDRRLLGDAVATQGLVPDLVVPGAILDEGAAVLAEVVGEQHVVGARVGVGALGVGARGALVAVVHDVVVVLVAAQGHELAVAGVPGDRQQRLDVVDLEGDAVAGDGVDRLGLFDGGGGPGVADSPPGGDAVARLRAFAPGAGLAQVVAALVVSGAGGAAGVLVDAVGSADLVLDVSHVERGAVLGRWRLGARAGPLVVDAVLVDRPVGGGPGDVGGFAVLGKLGQPVLQVFAEEPGVVAVGPLLAVGVRGQAVGRVDGVGAEGVVPLGGRVTACEEREHEEEGGCTHVEPAFRWRGGWRDPGSRGEGVRL